MALALALATNVTKTTFNCGGIFPGDACCQSSKIGEVVSIESGGCLPHKAQGPGDSNKSEKWSCVNSTTVRLDLFSSTDCSATAGTGSDVKVGDCKPGYSFPQPTTGVEYTCA
jgi:hypothetical protein